MNRKRRQKEDGNLKYIENINLRNVTYCKRKRGFIKKAIEISILCGQQLSILMFDQRKNKLVSYSTGDFTHESACKILSRHTETKNKKLEVYTDKDYSHFYQNQSIEEKNNPYCVYDVPVNENSNEFHKMKIENFDTISLLDQKILVDPKTEDYKQVFKQPSEPPLRNIEVQFSKINQKLDQLSQNTYEFNSKHNNYAKEVSNMKDFIKDANRFLEEKRNQLTT